MPLKTTVGLNAKVSLPNYGSIGASCHVEFELDQALHQHDLGAFHQQVRDAFVACRQAVEDELARQSRSSVPAKTSVWRTACFTGISTRQDLAASDIILVCFIAQGPAIAGPCRFLCETRFRLDGVQARNDLRSFWHSLLSDLPRPPANTATHAPPLAQADRAEFDQRCECARRLMGLQATSAAEYLHYQSAQRPRSHHR